MEKITTKILVSKRNGVRAIFDKHNVNVLANVGKIATRRASYVEPGRGLSQRALSCLDYYYSTVTDTGRVINDDVADHWFADMTPCGHDVVLGPFPPGDREEALLAERQFLEDRHLPVPI